MNKREVLAELIRLVEATGGNVSLSKPDRHLGLPILDHVIIGHGGKYASLAERGAW